MAVGSRLVFEARARDAASPGCSGGRGSENALQVPSADDERPVQTPRGAHPPFRRRRWRSGPGSGVRMILMPSNRNTSSKEPENLVSWYGPGTSETIPQGSARFVAYAPPSVPSTELLHDRRPPRRRSNPRRRIVTLFDRWGGDQRRRGRPADGSASPGYQKVRAFQRPPGLGLDRDD